MDPKVVKPTKAQTDSERLYSCANVLSRARPLVSASLALARYKHGRTGGALARPVGKGV